MDWINLVSMIVGILSLLATIAISVVIYVLQKNDDIKKHKEKIRQQAHDFLIENIDEKEFLPLAQFAVKVNPLYKHNRKIYNRFSRCNIELQKEILKQANFTDLKLDLLEDEFLNKFLDKFEKDAQNLNLLTTKFLYDGAKYFHRGISRYGTINIRGNFVKDKEDNENEYNYLPLDLYYIDTNQNYNIDIESDIWNRLLDYNTLKENKDINEEWLIKIKQLQELLTDKQTKYSYTLPDSVLDFENMHNTPPLDYYWNLVRSSREDECVYVVIEMVRQSTLMINRMNNKEWKIPFEGEYQIEKLEDLYYAAVQTLFCTFNKNF